MSDIPMLTGPNGGELVFDIDNGTIKEKLASGNLGEPQLYMHGEHICSEADFLRVKDRIAQLEADLAEAETALQDIGHAIRNDVRELQPREISQITVERIEWLNKLLAASREREAALAETLMAFRWTLDNEADCSEVDGPNTHAKILADFDQIFSNPSAILAAHDAEVARKAKIEQLEEALAGLNEQGALINGEDIWSICAEEIRDRIAALKEGGKG